MARTKSATLTEAELRLMNVVWEKGEATVSEVCRSFRGKKAPAYNTVLTIMRILEKKGYLGHTKKGRAHVYSPMVDRQQAQRSALGHIVSKFFDNSSELLVQNIIENEDITPEELERLKKMIEESEG